MGRSLGQFLWPQRFPLWLALASNTILTLVVLVATVVFLPKSILDKLPKIVRRQRTHLIGLLQWAARMTVKGPLGWFLFFICRRCSCGRCASRCRPPKTLRLKAVGCNEVQVTFSAQLPANPFHEEYYIVSMCEVRPTESEWVESEVNPHDIGGGKQRVVVKKLPSSTTMRMRACTVNNLGRSAWSEDATVETLARPSDSGGFNGPLLGGGRYTWSQTGAEVALRLPIGQAIRGKDMKITWTQRRLEIRCTAGVAADAEPGSEAPMLLGGPLPKKVKSDEVFWSIEEDEVHSRHVHLQMTKAEFMDKWPCLIDAPEHPKLDVALIGQFKEALHGINIIDMSK